MKIADLEKKKILITGFAREGLSTLKFLRKYFPKKRIGVFDEKTLTELEPLNQKFLSDDKNLDLYLGTNLTDLFNKYDLIIKSAGIPNKIIPDEVLAKTTSQTQIFFEEFEGVIIGVTGTKGKSTTASLIYEILKISGKKTVLLGNIGLPPLDQWENITKDTIVVFELSSHQLSTNKKSPHVAVLLNIYEEHLDYYKSFSDYVEAKAQITKYQTKDDYLVYNQDDKLVNSIAQKSLAQKVPFGQEELKNPTTKILETKLLGEFNRLNIMAATKVAGIFKVSEKDIQTAVRNFMPLEHRLELVVSYKQITFYNDSLATIPQATIVALDTLGEKVETIILGGFDRRVDYKNLARRLLNSSVKNLILFPTTGEKIWLEMTKLDKNATNKFQHFFVDNMKEAVRIAYKHTGPTKICLLSCASTSFNLFKDYRDRGNQFKKYVREFGNE